MSMTPWSSVRDVVWPAVMMGEGATLLALAFQLEQSQWWSPEDLQAHQDCQHSQDQVEVRFVRREPLSPSEEQTVRGAIHRALGYPFRLTFAGQDAIARQPNGKYESFFDAR